jgi:hypothetical protein
MSHVLDDTNVLDPEGREFPLGELWRLRPAVVVFPLFTDPTLRAYDVAG